MNEKIGIIADDFTGASDIASFMNLAGANSILINEIPLNSHYDYSSYDVIVIALKTRSVNVKDAINYTKAAYEFLIENDIKNIYFKYASTFDSTNDGNIGPVSDYLLETINQKYSLIIPSFPGNNRIVKDGILYVDGKKIEDTHMRNHPINPMKESNLIKLMENQSAYKAYHLSIDDIKYYIRDKKEFKNYILELSKKHKHFYIIPDYFENSHGKLIADLFSNLNFYTGASVFGGWLYQIKNNKSQNKYPSISQSLLEGTQTPTNGIILAGSLSKATRMQIENFKKYNYPSYEIQNKKIYENHINELENIKRFIRKNKTSPMLIYNEREKFHVPINNLLETVISEIGMFALDNEINNVVVAGGETSGAVVKKIGSNNFKIGQSISQGVPILKPLDKDREIKLVLKSGNFGEEDFFVKALYIMGES
ncbi:four-carbon acid sugar kinase family protein [Oceanobacillus timonensis]|uniref:four-carbon acid sugar kinase family protein n=1 Tax=Oceanobacillus timonensis TaxID=1926285 RepID=UPI0009BC0DBE|nr:four-carbon acid sugar kinase family protein [Oceanobacillus timonensis]